MSFTLVTVTGQLLDADDSPATGTVEFRLVAALQDSVTNQLIQPSRILATLDAEGRFSVTLPATDDPTTSPVGATYVFTARTAGARPWTRQIRVPHDATNGTLDIADAPPVSGEPLYIYALAGHTHADGGAGGGDGGTPTGAAGGVLSGTFPNPGFAVDMATQLELDAHKTATTGVHGIPNTALLETTAGAQAKADAAAAASIPVVQKGAPSGVTPLGPDSRIPGQYLPSLALTDTFVVGSQAAMLATAAQPGDVAIRQDLGKSFILAGSDPTVLGNWQELLTPTAPVSSVQGLTGAVSLPVDGSAGTASLRTLGTSGAQAAAGNDPRLSDTRTPTDGSVTTAKIADGQVTLAKMGFAVAVPADVAGEAAARTAADGDRVAKAGDTMSGGLILPTVEVTGKNGLATRRLVGRKTTAGAPTTGTWSVNDEIDDPNGVRWRCTVAGTPGTWVQLSALAVLLGASNGVDDTASINAILAAAPAGSVVRGLPGETYLISAPLKLRAGGRQTLDMTGCTVAFANTGVRTNMLNNAAVTPPATANDVTTTAGSSVITSAVLVAAGAAVGMSVGVVAAGPSTGGGGAQPRIWFYGSITAVAGNNITLGGMYQYGTANPNQADVSLVNATAHLFATRDSDVTVVGGTWDAGTNWNVFADRYNAAYDSCLLRFRRCDGLTVRNVKLAIDYGYVSSGMGWCFGVAPGDCSNILIERITNPAGKAAPTFVNSSGMIQKCVVRDIVGTAYDDMVAFGCVGAGGDDVEGDIGDLLIDGVLSTWGGPAAWAGMGSNRGVDLYCGKGSNGKQRVLWNAQVRSVKGPYNAWPVSLVSYPAVAGQGANFIADLRDITGYKIGGGPAVFIGRADGTNGGLNNGLDCVGTVTGPNTGTDLAQAQITASPAVTGPAVADVPGLSVTFVAPPSGVVWLEAYIYSIAQTVATGNINAFIADSGNATKVQNFLGSIAAGGFSNSMSMKVRVSGLVSGTSYTFKVRVSGSAGSQQVLANAAYPAFLRAIAA